MIYIKTYIFGWKVMVILMILIIEVCELLPYCFHFFFPISSDNMSFKPLEFFRKLNCPDKCHGVEKLCSTLAKNFLKPSLGSSSSDLQKKASRYEWKNRVYQTGLFISTALRNLLYKLLSDCIYCSLLCFFFFAFQHDNLTW